MRLTSAQRKARLSRQGGADRRARAGYLNNLGSVRMRMEKHAEAISALAEASQLLADEAEPQLLASVYGNMGDVYAPKPDRPTALSCSRRLAERKRTR